MALCHLTSQSLTGVLTHCREEPCRTQRRRQATRAMAGGAGDASAGKRQRLAEMYKQYKQESFPEVERARSAALYDIYFRAVARARSTCAACAGQRCNLQRATQVAPRTAQQPCACRHAHQARDRCLYNTRCSQVLVNRLCHLPSTLVVTQRRHLVAGAMTLSDFEERKRELLGTKKIVAYWWALV